MEPLTQYGKLEKYITFYVTLQPFLKEDAIIDVGVGLILLMGKDPYSFLLTTQCILTYPALQHYYFALLGSNRVR